ncbi:MAG: hypothetical protein EOP01_09555, partial [Propionibacteriaceae bacterium]
MPERILPNSVLRAPVRDAPLAPDSAHLVAHLVEQVKSGPYGPVPALNTTQYGVGVYTVSDQPYVPVLFRDEQRKGYLPDIFAPEVTAGGKVLRPAGSCAWAPIPPDAKPSPGTDGALSVYEPATGRLWNFWRAQRAVDGSWSAVWAGHVPDTRVADGRFTGYSGTSASGLVMEEMVVGVAEARARRITHAIGLAITNVAMGAASFPAVRTDGNSPAANALHEGRRFRLRADVDLTALRTTPNWAGKTLPLANLTYDIALAAKEYGFVICDRSYGVSIGCEMGTP